jgi:hypothetical protein
LSAGEDAVDNRLKDITDALHGRAGGPKANRPVGPTLENDRGIYRVVIENTEPPKQSRREGHIIIRKWKMPRWMSNVKLTG